MSELLKILLSLSLSGTLLFFIVLALKPLYKNKLSKRWQYYIWLIVIVRMLIPFTPETTLVGSAFQHLDNINVATIQTIPFTNDTQADFDTDKSNLLPNGQPQEPQSNIDTTPSLSIQTIITKLFENLWMLWAAIAFALLIRKITMYQSFVRFVKAGRAEVSEIEILNMLADAGETVGVKRPVELFTNPLISSPMLLGFFRPYIILPSIELDKTELAYIMRHELTHYKHLDMFYKWLVQITVCLHWFNPFAYLMVKEINKCCELSCDEVIIRTLDKDEKKAYGDTLLNSLKAMGNYNDKLATVTLAESAEQLKERLDAIMKFKKKSKSIVAITLVFTTMLCVGATAVGAYAAPKIAISKTPETINTSNKAEVSYDKEYAEWNVTHVDDAYYYKNEPVRIFMDLRADNSFANFSYNETGNIDLRLVRNANDSIVQVEYISKTEANEILSDLEQNPTAKEDIKRLTLEEVPDAIQSAVNSCDDKTWYVIDGDGRKYIYYNNLPHNYAYQYEPKQSSLKIVDIGKTNDNYVLLSVPINTNLTISYNSKSVTYKSVPQSNIKENTSSKQGQQITSTPSSMVEDNLTLVTKEYSMADIKSLNISGIIVKVLSENVSITRGGETLKMEYYIRNQNDYTLKNESDAGGTFEELVLRRVTSVTSGDTERPISITIPDNISFKVISATTSSGNITLKNCSGENVIFQTQSGDITINGGFASNVFAVETGSGNAIISDFSANEYGIDFQTKSGTITFNGVDYEVNTNAIKKEDEKGILLGTKSNASDAERDAEYDALYDAGDIVTPDIRKLIHEAELEAHREAHPGISYENCPECQGFN